ncbi:hypothetical protein [Parabacteroides gordonii]|uniref:hypothetical protein n=1 Tax=Parabacteroides gordonii TaxID=574930 RepID=UPI0012FBD220|nr:hypothetical protein [Parabacteroides gordonii]MCA5585472.1 hypothetical protein [Parabacteroides gordonii]
MMDSLIFEITEDTFYITFLDWKIPIELMRYNKTMLKSDWLWYHLQGMRSCMPQYPKEWIASVPKLKPVSRSAHWPGLMKRTWLFWWAYRSDLPKPEELFIPDNKEYSKELINHAKKNFRRNSRLWFAGGSTGL